ncbi:MAG: PQQ-binding-like beta-propeller repeat protein [Bacteroidetes bacterium]|nr:PQQ-binding-like beta-propeller repeat protein [Bacteroidota bacterium]
MWNLNLLSKNITFFTFFTLFIITDGFISCSKSGSDAPTGNSSVGVIVVTTSTVGAITGNNAAAGGHVASDGGVNVSARGICWSTSPHPTVADSKTFDGTGTGFFVSTMSGLSFSTSYYVRAYATNATGSYYGEEFNFTTTATNFSPQNVTTTTATSIGVVNAVSGGEIGLDGGSPVLARGVCWSTTPGPTTANAKTVDGSGTGSFTSSMTGLAPKTTYYYRSYAINAIGTTYGSELSLTTQENTLVFIGGYDNNFYAINGVTGTLKWIHLGTNFFGVAGPCFANGKIYAASSDKKLYCMDTLNGAVLWTYTTGSTIESDPVYSNGTIYVGSDDYYLYAIDAATGALRWKFATGFNVTASPLVYNGIVYFGSDDSKMYAVSESTGQLIWSYQALFHFGSSGATVANGVIYAGCGDNNVYAFDAATGILKWKYNTGYSMGFSSPTVVNNVLYIGGYYSQSNSKGSLYAIDATNGQLVWEKYQNTGFNSSPLISNGRLFIATEGGDLLALDPANGALFWKRTIYNNGASPAIANGIIYIGGGGTNFIYAIDAQTGGDKWKIPITNSSITSGACIVTPSGVQYSGKSGMQN